MMGEETLVRLTGVSVQKDLSPLNPFFHSGFPVMFN